MGIVEIATIVLVTLKLLDLLDWSWSWVFSGLIAEGAIAIVLSLTVICVYGAFSDR